MSDTDTASTKTETTEQPDEITTTAEVHHEEKKSFGEIIKKDPLYDEVSKILHWRDPVRSGLLFGIANLFYILFTWGEYSVITLVSYLLLSLLIVCFGYKNYIVLKAQWIGGKKVENPFLEKFKDQKFNVRKEAIEKHVDTLLDLINFTIDEYREVFFITSNFLALKFAFYFYLGATVGEWFDAVTLLYLGLLGAFIWPRLYEEKHNEIDHFYGIAKENVDKYVQLALSKVPPAVTAYVPQLKAKTT